MIFRSHGYSLLEVLVTVGILGVLASVAIPTYQRYKEAPIKLAMKTEASELSKFLNYAHSVDGGYHQKIFTMGYRPNKNLIADTGFEYARGAAPSCSIFPPNATTTANKEKLQSFFTIKEESYTSSNVESATRARHICNGGHCSVTDTVVPGKLTAQSFSSGHTGCVGEFNGKSFHCGCNNFKIYSRAYIRSGVEAKVLVNQNGVFGYSDSSGHIDLY